MNVKSILLAVFAGWAGTLSAGVPSAEQLLPADTLGLVTVPDWNKASAAYSQAPALQLWRDPEVKAFKEKLVAQFQSQIVAPLERELGVKLTDYAELLQGQVTLAFSLPAGGNGLNAAPGWCVLVDTKDKSDQLKKNLADLKKKWADGGKPIRTEKLRDLEFTTLSVTAAEFHKAMKNAFPQFQDKGDSENKSDEKVALTFGQSDSLFLIGSNPKDLEKILARQAGGQTLSLGEQPEFQANQGLFRQALALGWLNIKPITTLIGKKVAEAAAANKGNNPMMPKPDKIFSALGVQDLKTLAFSAVSQPEGNLVEVLLSVPESSRKGLFKALVADAKNANPPPFVPADVAKFNRWRLDGQRTWATIEAMVTEISPEMGSMIQMGLAAAGKDKDQNFDVKKSLIGNLGDDFINYQKSPKSFNLEALNSPPSLLLVGSPNADQLASAVKTAASIMVPPSSLKEREFLGRKIYSVPFSTPNSEDPDRTLSFAASRGYVAISTDAPFLEEYLRSGENKPKSLDDNAALKEAAQKVGGTSTGFFGYENQSDTMRTAVETLRKDPTAFDKLFSMGSRRGAPSTEELEKLKAWLDFSLLPPYEKIAKYFYFTVYSSSASSEGIGLKFFSPNPPELKR